MAGIFGSSGRHRDPLGVIAALVGIGGAACSALLWVYQINPDSTVLGSYSAQMTNGGRLGSQLVLLAAVLGVMAVIAGAMTGACLGFLWFNCNPARVFMGDTGSLALGGLIGYISIVIRQELMLFLVGGIFVAEAVSVMLQVGYFKYTRRRYGEGRRIFLMSPLHHHFQRKGWTETQVVVRFWCVGAMLAVMALVTVKLR